jgi:ribonuclease HI
VLDILNKEPIEIWSDGSSSNNKTRCTGFATILKYKNHYREYWGGFEPDTTNQQVEIYSALHGLLEINTTNIPIHIYSDSAYLINGMNDDWVNTIWRMNGWVNSKKKPVSNQSLWELIDEVAKKQLHIEWRKVKGHVGVELNERADKLAVKGRHDIEVKLGLRDSKEAEYCTCKDCKKVETEKQGIFRKWEI